MTSKTYYFKLKAVSPIHIGCDDVYEPTGFAVDEKKEELISFDPAQFLGMLEQQDLDKFSEICRKGTIASLIEIYKFIRQHKEHADGRRVQIPFAFVNHYNKTLGLAPREIQKQLNKFLVARTAYNKIDSLPYIPGSAIKGSIRTAILNWRNQDKTYPKYHNGKQLNDELAGGTFCKDPFRLIKISDFKAVGNINQKIIYAINRKKRPSKKEAMGPYQILEVIEAGAEFIGSITISSAANIAKKQSIDLEEINQAITSFYNGEHKKEKDCLQAIGCDAGMNNHTAEKLLRVGRHSGAECVTVAGQRKIKIKQGPRKYSDKDHSTTLWLAANSKSPGTNNNLEPFGWAELSLLSNKEFQDFSLHNSANFKKWETDQRELIIRMEENAALLARQQAVKKIEQQRLAEEKRKKEEELRENPWRAIIPELKRINDWGALKNNVLEHNNFLEHQKQNELGQAVFDTAVRVAKNNLKTWNTERDDIINTWLKPSSLKWTNLARTCRTTRPVKDNSTLLAKINSLEDWDSYKISDVKIPKLDKQCADALKIKFQEWKLKKSKDKQQQKTFKALNKKIKKLS